MSASSVPSIVFNATGIQIPLESDILAGVQADQNAAFGGNLNPALSTPQGQLASSTTAIIGDKNSEIALIVNQLDPLYADGIFQDAIGRIYFLTRNPAVATAVQCECIGAVGTVIPVGAQAQATDGNIYVCTESGTIPIGGSITLSFACAVTGPVACPANSVIQIYQSIVGWDTIGNSSAGVPGSNVEGRADFEYRRQQSVALNGHGSLQSIYASVFDCAGVIDVYATENVSDVAITAGATNYSLKPHSLYVAVVGGSSADIAQAIWLKKNEGSNMNGNTTQTVVDANYSYPQPTYTITYEIPESTAIKFAVQIANNGTLPPDIVDRVKTAILAAFAGADGGSRARIGSTLYASRYFSGIAAISPTVEIVSVLLGIVTPTLNTITMGIDQAPTVSTSDITVTLV